MVRAARHHDLHVPAGMGGGDQEREERAVGYEVGRHDRDRSLAVGEQFHVGLPQRVAFAVGSGGDDLDARWADMGRAFAEQRREMHRGLVGGLAPVGDKDALDGGCGRSFDQERAIAEAAVRGLFAHVAQAEVLAADDGEGPIKDRDLAMVTPVGRAFTLHGQSGVEAGDHTASST